MLLTLPSSHVSYRLPRAGNWAFNVITENIACQTLSVKASARRAGEPLISSESDEMKWNVQPGVCGHRALCQRLTLCHYAHLCVFVCLRLKAGTFHAAASLTLWQIFFSLLDVPRSRGTFLQISKGCPSQKKEKKRKPVMWRPFLSLIFFPPFLYPPVTHAPWLPFFSSPL